MGQSIWQEFQLGDLRLESCARDRVHGLVITVASPDSTATARGLEKYKSPRAKALLKSFGEPVQLNFMQALTQHPSDFDGSDDLRAPSERA
jgi:hypothetical protein